MDSVSTHNALTMRQKLPSYGKLDIKIYECICIMLICGGILLKFQQNTRFEMCNPIKVELLATLLRRSYGRKVVKMFCSILF